jgi:tRNA dimethylallyltransferase
LDEVRHLEQRGLRDGRTAPRALGYAQALAQLDGTMTQEQAQEETSRLTRRFARRQESWFGADPRIHWLEAGCETSHADRLEQALDLVGAAIRDNGSHG